MLPLKVLAQLLAVVLSTVLLARAALLVIAARRMAGVVLVQTIVAMAASLAGESATPGVLHLQ
jgi:hypothetical protein